MLELGQKRGLQHIAASRKIREKDAALVFGGAKAKARLQAFLADTISAEEVTPLVRAMACVDSAQERSNARVPPPPR